MPLVMQYLQSAKGVPAFQIVTEDRFAKDNLAETKGIFDFLGIKSGRLDRQISTKNKRALLQEDGIVYTGVATFVFESETDRSKFPMSERVFRGLRRRPSSSPSALTKWSGTAS
jgi:preprotein translocase subunit SecA